MSKVLMFEEGKEDILDKLFEIREEDIESRDKDYIEFINKNDINAVTEEDLITEIGNIPNITMESKEWLLKNFDVFINKQLQLYSYMQKKYYKAGVGDIVDILMSKK